MESTEIFNKSNSEIQALPHIIVSRTRISILQQVSQPKLLDGVMVRASVLNVISVISILDRVIQKTSQKCFTVSLLDV